MIYLFVLTTFIFLALWLNARKVAAMYKRIASEAVESGKEVIQIHTEYQENAEKRFAEIGEISNRLKQRLQR